MYINRTMFWLFTMLFGAVLVWALMFSIHHARAADEEAGPKWKIVVTIEAQDGKHSLAYGTADRTGIQWYKDLAECEKAKKTDARLNSGLKLLKQQLKQMRQQVELTVECKPDNSV